MRLDFYGWEPQNLNASVFIAGSYIRVTVFLVDNNLVIDELDAGRVRKCTSDEKAPELSSCLSCKKLELNCLGHVSSKYEVSFT